MNYVKLIAPAKINLVLAVGDRLPDGYHEVHTIMHALALHDTLEIRRFEVEDDDPSSINITVETLEGVEELILDKEENIVYQAVLRLASALGRTAPEQLDIKLSKRIPHQAGLGGGSADAAATLIGLAQLWDINPKDPVIEQVAAALGADVPFFLYGGCAYFDGRGDHFVHELEPRKGFLVLVRPEGAGVSSAEAYRTFDEDPELPSQEYLATIAEQTSASAIDPWNNLSAAAIKLKPELNEVFALLERSPLSSAVVLCGSGSAVAALCESYEDAAALSLEAHKAGWYSRVTSFASLGAAALKSF